MSVVIEIDGKTATITNGTWSSDHPRLLRQLRSYPVLEFTADYAPSKDWRIALQVARDMQGIIKTRLGGSSGEVY
jgi:hypothetical protein